jgi:hypothetical protein
LLMESIQLSKVLPFVRMSRRLDAQHRFRTFKKDI